MLRAKQPPSVRHCKVDSMEQAKDKKLQAGAVPDAHDKHGEDCRSRYHMKKALWVACALRVTFLPSLRRRATIINWIGLYK